MAATGTRAPLGMPMDVYRTGDGSYHIEADLPGVDPDSVDVTVEHSTASRLVPVRGRCGRPTVSGVAGGLRGAGRDEPPGHVFAVCDLDCRPDRSGYPAAGLDRAGRLGLGIAGQFEGRPACTGKDDPPGPGMGGRALMSRHAADQAGPFGAPGRGPVLASTMGTPGATAAATAAKRSRSSRQPVIL